MVTPEQAAERAADILDQAAKIGVVPERVAALVGVADGWTRLHTALANAPKTIEPVTVVDKVRNVRDQQGSPGTWNSSEYMRGLYNGLELALSILEGERNPEYRDPPDEQPVTAPVLWPALAMPINPETPPIVRVASVDYKAVGWDFDRDSVGSPHASLRLKLTRI